MFRLAARAVIWAIDGPGARWRGVQARAVVFIVMMLPVVLNVIGMHVFGYSRGSTAYEWMTAATITCWFFAFSYLAAILSYGLFRLGETIWVAVFRHDGEHKK